MLYYNFKNFEEFKERFGFRVCNNGTKVRQNKLLLTLMKSKVYLKNDALRAITDMTQLESVLFREIALSTFVRYMSYGYVLEINSMRFYSKDRYTDDCLGICDDGSIEHIRNLQVQEDGRHKLIKSKAGKLFREIVLSTSLGEQLPAEVVNYLCEVFASNWRTYVLDNAVEKYELHVDDNFWKIYSSSHLEYVKEYGNGVFNSCMTDKGYHTFYENAVKAKAAYLTNRRGKIIVRAILFPEVFDENGNKWRLLERQYADENDNDAKKLLIKKLIDAGEIDGYKKVGAGCADTQAFIGINGESLSNYSFHIKCYLLPGDTVSYQDSFRYYDYYKDVAYNYECCAYTDELVTTRGEFEHYGGDDYYDEYHDCYCEEVETVWCHGREITCDTERLDDFRWCENIERNVHEDDALLCPCCGDYYAGPNEDGESYYSELLDEDFCCERCRARAEQEYKEENWYYCEDIDDYCEEAEYSELLDKYFSTKYTLDVAELDYKDRNYDWCVDTESYEDPDTTFYSELTQMFYSTEEARSAAEVDFNRDHAA